MGFYKNNKLIVSFIKNNKVISSIIKNGNITNFISWDKMAVQKARTDKPNYNPSFFEYVNSFILSAKEYITIKEAESLTSFNDKKIDDVISLCTSLELLKYFTSIYSLPSNFASNHTELLDVTFSDKLVSISDSCFSGCTGLTKINIPQSVGIIYSNAFNGCTNLNNLTFNYGLLNLQSSAFEGCSKITALSLPESLTAINANCFKSCSTLQTVYLPSSLTFLDTDCFAQCYNLNKIYINNIYNWIGISRTQSCEFPTLYTLYDKYDNNNIVENISISAIVDEIRDNIFANCSSIKTVTTGMNPLCPDSLTIGSRSFASCRNLERVSLDVKNDITIKAEAFVQCYKLNYFKVTKHLKEIQDSAFGVCSEFDATSLFDYIDTDTLLGNSVFQNTAITSVSDDMLNKINLSTCGIKIFAGCPITNLTINNKQILDKQIFYYTAPTTLTINVDFDGATNWFNSNNLTSLTFNGSTVKLPYNTFYNSSRGKLESVTFGENTQLLELGESTFASAKITSLDLSKMTSLTSINDMCFYFCTKLESISLPASITKIGKSAFWGCYLLSSFTFGGTIAQWNAITKGNYWYDTKQVLKTIHCSDGDVTL